jgi:hypothetical protein
VLRENGRSLCDCFNQVVNMIHGRELRNAVTQVKDVAHPRFSRPKALDNGVHMAPNLMGLPKQHGWV